MSNIIPFPKDGKLPAHIGKRFKLPTDLVLPGGFPVLSIKGKVFHVVRGDEKKLLVDAEDEALRTVEVCIVGRNPSISKVFYQGTYVEGSQDNPDCYSNNGETPEKDSESPQAKRCATCPHNQWGSRVTEDGKKAKACADVRRIAVSSPSQINDPMLLRVPATSMKPLSEYAAMLTKRGIALEEVVTRIGFDSNVAYPALTFKPIGFCDSDTVDAIEAIGGELVVKQILGLAPVEQPEDEGELPKIEVEEEPKIEVEEEPKVEEEPPKPKKVAKKTAKKVAKKAAAKAEEPATGGPSDDELEDALDGFFNN